jgi:hypothetical protein
MTLTPVFAQAAIQEPGLFAFHPNADVLNGGAPTPEAALASAPPAASGGKWQRHFPPSVIAPTIPRPAPSSAMRGAGIGAGESGVVRSVRLEAAPSVERDIPTLT